MSLKPILNSPLDRPASSLEDVLRDIRSEVKHALADTDDRIDSITREIADKQGALSQLEAHRLALREWLAQDKPAQ